MRIAVHAVAALALASIPATAAIKGGPGIHVLSKADKAAFRAAVTQARKLPRLKPQLPVGLVLESHETVTPRAPWQGQTGLQVVVDSTTIYGKLLWDVDNDRLRLPAAPGAEYIHGPATGLRYVNALGRSYLATCTFELNPEVPQDPGLGTVSWHHASSPEFGGSGTFADLTVYVAIPPGTGGNADLRLVVPERATNLRQCDLYGFTLPH